MALPLPPFQGACLCGAVTLHVTAPPLLTMACHCHDCQKLTASAYSLTTMFPAKSVTCEGELVSGALRSEGRVHSFCATCLGFVHSQIGAATWRINLRTTLLENAAEFPPFIEVMTRQKLPWAHVPATHSYATGPASLDELDSLMADYAKR